MNPPFSSCKIVEHPRSISAFLSGDSFSMTTGSTYARFHPKEANSFFKLYTKFPQSRKAHAVS